MVCVTPEEGEGQRPDWFWELAIAVNAAFKGLLGSMGESGHICASTEAVEGEVDTTSGWEAALRQLCGLVSSSVQDGDVVVVADKVVSAALGRTGPRQILIEPDPKTVPANRLPELAAQWSDQLGFEVSPKHLLLADELGHDQATLGTDDPNRRAGQIAAALREAYGVKVDVVISDTDTGLDTRSPIIGTLTIGATPIGATAGVNLYEAMRCAVAAEFVRGHRRRIPVVVCRPAQRRSVRADISELRYAGFLDAAREKGLTHA